MDALLTWQLPPVPGINQAEIGWFFMRPGIQPTMWRLEWPYTLGWSMFNRTAILPASDLFSNHRLSYRDPTTGQLVPVVLQAGDFLQGMVSLGASGRAGSPSAASAAIWFPVQGQPMPTVAPAFTERQENAFETLPPALNVQLTLLP